MAGRIPQHFIDEVLNRVDIVEVIDSRVSLKKMGRSFKACCPFHDEKTPSFNVNPDKQFFHCFGCGAGGNALTFLMDYERLEFRAALENLASRCGLEVPEESPQHAQQSLRKKDLYQILTEVDNFYRQSLRGHDAAKQAVDYLKARGLSGQIAGVFGLGFVPAGWDNLLGKYKADKTALELLMEAGMLVSRDDADPKARVYDRFRHRIMFPIRDSRGRTIAFGGRVLGDDKPKYLNSPETPIFHKGRELYGLYEARQANAHLARLLIVEGYMDVIALAQAGITYAVATLGTSTSTAHMQRLFRHCQEVVFCFDGDKAGIAAARRALDAALSSMDDGRQVRFLFLPEGEDPDTLVRQEGAEVFKDRIDEALPLSEYVFQIAAENVDISTPDGKAALSQNAIRLINQLPSGAFRQIMLAELAKRTGLESSAIEGLAQLDAQQANARSAARAGGRAASSLGSLGYDVESGVELSVPEVGAYDTAYQEMGMLEAEGLPELDAQGQSARPHSRREPAKFRPVTQRERPSSLSLAQAAMSLVLYKPQLAKLAPDLKSLELLDDSDVTLLLEIFRLLAKRPDSSTGMLLGYWYGQPEGEKLTELCGRGIDLLREGVDALKRQGADGVDFELGLEQQFLDVMQKLSSIAPKNRLDTLLDLMNEKHRQGVQLEPELGAELKQLLAKRNEEDEER